jgi:hypothetical protein
VTVGRRQLAALFFVPEFPVPEFPVPEVIVPEVINFLRLGVKNSSVFSNSTSTTISNKKNLVLFVSFVV